MFKGKVEILRDLWGSGHQSRDQGSHPQRGQSRSQPAAEQSTVVWMQRGRGSVFEVWQSKGVGPSNQICAFGRTRTVRRQKGQKSDLEGRIQTFVLKALLKSDGAAQRVRDWGRQKTGKSQPSGPCAGASFQCTPVRMSLTIESFKWRHSYPWPAGLCQPAFRDCNKALEETYGEERNGFAQGFRAFSPQFLCPIALGWW